VLAAVGLCLLLATACSGGAAARPVGGVAAKSTGDPAKGKELFTQSCIACHGPDARGLPELGKDMTTSAFIKDKSDAQLVDFVKKGRPASDPANTTRVDMPAKGGNPTITDVQLGDIVAYVRTLQR
jgi:mono/diheme cytochrome c family protein